MIDLDLDEGGPYDGNTPPGELPPSAARVVSPCPTCGAELSTAHTCLPIHTNGTVTPHKCPCCDGTGLVSRPPGMAGDVPGFTTSGSAAYPCRACTGTGVLWR